MNEKATEAEVGALVDKAAAVRHQIRRVMVGYEEPIEELLCCLLAGGHALIEGVPGLGKTSLVKAMGDALGLPGSRIQFTPDLMPADIIGTDVLVRDQGEEARVVFRKGPIFASVVLADEINRATPKTQSALLEAMQESAVTVGGTRYPLEPPFMVLATQNPLEMEGTYPLPEAQMDRFLFKVTLGYPLRSELIEILDRTTGGIIPEATKTVESSEVLGLRSLVREVPIPTEVRDYAVTLVLATHPGEAGDSVSRFVRYGASPRAAQALVLGAKAVALLDGRYSVSYEDIRRVAAPALRHRLILTFEGEAEGITTDTVIREILETTTP